MNKIFKCYDESEVIECQKYLFRNGYKWITGSSKVNVFLNYPVYLFTTKQDITYGHNILYEEYEKYKHYDFRDYIPALRDKKMRTII